jgi:hypothetical protein
MEIVLCTVCGNEVPKDQAQRQEYQEEKSYEKYYFCSGGAVEWNFLATQLNIPVNLVDT